MSHGLTSIVHCDAAVRGWSVSCYLWTLLWFLFIGQLWEVRKPLPGLSKVTSICVITGCFLFLNTFVLIKKLHTACLMLNYYCNTLIETKMFSIDWSERNGNWVWKMFFKHICILQRRTEHQPQHVPLSLIKGRKHVRSQIDFKKKK